MPITAQEINGMRLKYIRIMHIMTRHIWYNALMNAILFTTRYWPWMKNWLTLYLVNCIRVASIALVGRGPEKSCGTRILGLAKIGAASAGAQPTTQWLKFVIRLKLISLIIFCTGWCLVARGAMGYWLVQNDFWPRAQSSRCNGLLVARTCLDKFLNLITLRWNELNITYLREAL